MNNVEKAKQFLTERPGYTKSSYSDVADIIGVTRQDVAEAMKEIKHGPKVQGTTYNNPVVHTEFEEFLKWKASKGKTEVKPTRSLPKPFQGNTDNVLVIGDLHAPFILDGYLEFCREQQEKFNCGTVVFIGDAIDNHAISYHESDADGLSAGAELLKAKEQLADWYAVFPKVKVCIGNHDKLPYRKAYTFGMPQAWMKSFTEVLGSPEGWDWDFHHVINGVYYTHGTGASGDAGAMKIATQNRQSTVIGHLHSIANVKHSASYKDIIFSMSVGCGVDYKAYAFNYGKDMVAKPVISCGIVLEGRVPIVIPMAL